MVEIHTGAGLVARRWGQGEHLPERALKRAFPRSARIEETDR